MTNINWDEHIQEAKRLYESGVSLNQISKHFGVYHGALAKALKNAGIALRPRYHTGPRKTVRLPGKRRAPKSRSALARGATADQAERIHYRELNISGLTSEMKKATDESKRQRLERLIQEQMDDIERILGEGRTADEIDSHSHS